MTNAPGMPAPTSMDIRAILVPVDFSSCSLSLTQQAASLAARLGARLVVLHVATLPAGMNATTRLGGTDTAAALLVDDARERLGRFVRAAQAAGAPEVTAAVELGAVVPAILAAAETLEVDMIAMGTHGRTGLARIMLGSVAEGVTREAMVPVLLVRRQPTPACGRDRCDWCSEHGSDVERRVAVETEG